MTQESNTTEIRDKEIQDAREALSAKKFGDEIKKLRLGRNLNQEELGKLTGDKQGVISRVEKANYGVTLDLVYRLAIALRDDPYRLAAIFWDSYSKDYLDKNTQTLNAVWNLLSEYFLRVGDIVTTPEKEPLPFDRNKQANDILNKMDQQIMDENPKPNPSSIDITEEQELN